MSLDLVVDHSIRPKLAPEVKSVLETIFLITLIAAAILVPPDPTLKVSDPDVLYFLTEKL